MSQGEQGGGGHRLGVGERGIIGRGRKMGDKTGHVVVFLIHTY